MRAVWSLEPCAAPAVQEALQKTRGWTYSTVRTLMDRMSVKGLLSTEKVRHLTLYRSNVTNQEAQRGEVLSALDQAFEGALTPMVMCLLDTTKLKESELADLERLVREKRKKARS